MITFRPELGGGDELIFNFPVRISPKVNAIVQMEFELADFKATIHHFTHYVTMIRKQILTQVDTKEYSRISI